MDPVAGSVFGVGLVTLGAMVHYVKNRVANGTIQRNSAMGIRTKATLSSDSAWRAGHASAAPMLTATFLTAYALGALSLAISLALTLSDTRNAAAVVVPLAGIVVVLVLLTAAALKANSAARAAGHSDE